MKKIAIVLLMALALVSIATAEVTLSGEFEYGMMANSSAFAGEFDKIELDINADIDEYNSFSMELEDDIKTNVVAADKDGDGDLDDWWLAVNWATVATDWAGILDLPMAVSTTVGYSDFGYLDSLYVTGLGLEQEGFWGFYLPKMGSAKVEIAPADMISFMVAANFDNWASATPVLVGATIDVAPVLAKFAYDLEAERFGGEVSFGMDLAEDMSLTVGVPFWYNLADSPAVGSEYFYGVGVGFGVAGANLGVSLNGNDDEALADLGFDVNYGLTEELTVDVDAIMDMRSTATDSFQGLSVSATYAAGAVAYTLGYAYDAAGDGYKPYKAETSVVDGGVFMTVQLDF